MSRGNDGVPACFDTPEFKDERDRWYARLAEDGFEDVETVLRVTGHPGPLLKGTSPSPGDLSRGLYRQDKEDYYRWASQHVFDMPPGPDRHVWRLHAAGLSANDIAESLLGRYEGLTRGGIERIVKRERDAMVAAASDSLDTPSDVEDDVREVMAEATMPAWMNYVPKGPVKDGRPKYRDRRGA